MLANDQNHRIVAGDLHLKKSARPTIPVHFFVIRPRSGRSELPGGLTNTAPRIRDPLLFRQSGGEKRQAACEERTGCLATAYASLLSCALGANTPLVLAMGADHVFVETAMKPVKNAHL